MLDNVYLGTNNAVRLTVGEAHEARHGKQDGGVGESMQVAAPGIDDVHPSSASCVRAATRKQGAGARRSGESRTAAPTPVWFCTPRGAGTPLGTGASRGVRGPLAPRAGVDAARSGFPGARFRILGVAPCLIGRYLLSERGAADVALSVMGVAAVSLDGRAACLGRVVERPGSRQAQRPRLGALSSAAGVPGPLRPALPVRRGSPNKPVPIGCAGRDERKHATWKHTA